MRTQATRQRAHEGLVAEIRRQIQNGVLHPDHYLLPERELAKKYGVSSRAIREGLARLEAEGLIRRHQGRGTIVLRQEIKAPLPRQRSVAVIFQGRVRDTSTAQDFDGLQQSFQRDGYGTTLYVADGLPDKETAIVERLAAEGVPGLVLYSAHPSNSDAHLRAAIKAGMKIVVYDHDFPDLDCNFVGIDDQLAAYEATEHLIRLGCRELLLINSQRCWTTHTLRQRGFEEAAAALAENLPRRVLLLPNRTGPGELIQTLRQELSSILGELRRPVGIVAWWDEIALGAIDCLREAGWSVPDEARVIGFANDLRGQMAEVPLTTMAIPREEIARLAVATLVTQMRDPNHQPQRIRLKARMIIRESCGTYPRRAEAVSGQPGAASAGGNGAVEPAGARTKALM